MQFKTQTDWRLRAVSAGSLSLRTNKIYINSDDLK